MLTKLLSNSNGVVMHICHAHYNSTVPLFSLGPHNLWRKQDIETFVCSLLHSQVILRGPFTIGSIYAARISLKSKLVKAPILGQLDPDDRNIS